MIDISITRPKLQLWNSLFFQVASFRDQLDVFIFGNTACIYIHTQFVHPSSSFPLDRRVKFQSWKSVSKEIGSDSFFPQLNNR